MLCKEEKEKFINYLNQVLENVKYSYAMGHMTENAFIYVYQLFEEMIANLSK